MAQTVQVMTDDVPEVSGSRALMTDHERRSIARSDEEVTDQQHYVAVSRVRSRVEESLSDDVEILSEYKPELLEEIREVVCEESE